MGLKWEVSTFNTVKLIVSLVIVLIIHHNNRNESLKYGGGTRRNVYGVSIHTTAFKIAYVYGKSLRDDQVML